MCCMNIFSFDASPDQRLQLEQIEANSVQIAGLSGTEQCTVEKKNSARFKVTMHNGTQRLQFNRIENNDAQWKRKDAQWNKTKQDRTYNNVQ